MLNSIVAVLLWIVGFAWRRLHHAQPVSAPRQAEQPALRLMESVYQEIRRTIGTAPAERGGLLGGDSSGNLVTHFYYDAGSHRTGATYSPDTATVNRLLKEEWNPKDVRLAGFVHSHPPGFTRPSSADIVYARRILDANPQLEGLLLPIVLTEPDSGRFQLLAFAVRRWSESVGVDRLLLEIVPDGKAVATSAVTPVLHSSLPGTRILSGTSDRMFARVQQSYDLARLARARVVVVGVGGAAAFAEALGRCGVGQLVLIDPDVVEATNLATQSIYSRCDLGRPKVEVLAERIRDLNPAALVLTRQQRLEEISDAELALLVLGRQGAPVVPVVSLLVGSTDSFPAQARVAAASLELGVPSLCPQLYAQGRGLEVVFTYPGLTPACQRCVLSPRYEAYLRQNYRNAVTSAGTTMYPSLRANAIELFLALALLHHGSGHARWDGVLARVATRNLVQVRTDPGLGDSLGIRVFDRVLGSGEAGSRTFCDDILWLPQVPLGPDGGRPVCPDCGGTGDLRQSIGTFPNTRVIRRTWGEP